MTPKDDPDPRLWDAARLTAVVLLILFLFL
jgi:hypothetical protein